jgi:hypothetical protein
MRKRECAELFLVQTDKDALFANEVVVIRRSEFQRSFRRQRDLRQNLGVIRMVKDRLTSVQDYVSIH